VTVVKESTLACVYNSTVQYRTSGLEIENGCNFSMLNPRWEVQYLISSSVRLTNGVVMGSRTHSNVSFSSAKPPQVLSPEEAIQNLKALANPAQGPWVVLLLSGGHFAGAVFDFKGQVLVHSTAHR
jgi:hypothetical protein